MPPPLRASLSAHAAPLAYSAWVQGACRALGELRTRSPARRPAVLASNLVAAPCRLNGSTGRRRRRKARPARREREQVPLAGEVTQGRSGAKANPPPGCGRRREAALQGAGRYSDQAMQAAFADGWRIAERGESAVAEWRGAENRSAQTCHRGGERPRKPSGLCAEGWWREPDAPERNLLIVERRGTATPTPSAQGEARLGRTPPHDGRQTEPAVPAAILLFSADRPDGRTARQIWKRQLAASLAEMGNLPCGGGRAALHGGLGSPVRGFHFPCTSGAPPLDHFPARVRGEKTKHNKKGKHK